MKTINLYLASFLIIASVTSGFAQTNDPEFGVRAGVAFPSLRGGNSVSGQSNKMGFVAGVFARTGGDFYFQPEINFVTFKNSYTYQANSYESKFSQINVPLMVGYRLLKDEGLGLRVSAGPDLSYTLNKPAAPSGSSYKRLNAGGVLNAGIDIGGISFDARYSLGLTTINKQLDQKTGLFTIAAGFTF